MIKPSNRSTLVFVLKNGEDLGAHPSCILVTFGIFWQHYIRHLTKKIDGWHCLSIDMHLIRLGRIVKLINYMLKAN
jgi:hypothetical protein